jgi:hypothetical protein
MPALAKMLERDVKEGRLKPSLRIHASMDSSGPDDGKFEASRAKELRKEIAAIEKELEDWDPEEVAAQAERALKSELEIKKAQLAESDARAKNGKGHRAAAPAEGESDEDEDEDEEDYDAEDEDEENAKA